MKINVVVSEIKIPINRYIDKVHSDALWEHAAREWHRLYYKYIPRRTGNLANRVSYAPGQITHNMPYAIYPYNGHFNFRKDPHPLASRQWDKAAEPAMKPQLVAALQAYIDSGRLKLD